LLTKLEQMAVAAGLDRVELQAAGPAIEFYRRLGYRGRGAKSDSSWQEMEKFLGA
jgi:ribosomal protein S18 acetylase RimI-like enzyme